MLVDKITNKWYDTIVHLNIFIILSLECAKSIGSTCRNKEDIDNRPGYLQPAKRIFLVRSILMKCKCLFSQAAFAITLLTLSVPSFATQTKQDNAAYSSSNHSATSSVKTATPSTTSQPPSLQKKFKEIKAAAESDSSSINCLRNLEADAVSKLADSCEEEHQSYVAKSFALGKVLYQKKDGHWTCNAHARGTCALAKEKNSKGNQQ